MVTPYLMDNRLLRIREKTIREMKPDFLLSASYGINISDGASVASWAAERGGVTFTQATTDSKPTFLQHGLANGPCVLFDGADWMGVGSVVLTGEDPLIVVVGQLTTVSPGAIQHLISFTDGTSNNFLTYGLQDGGYTYTQFRNAGGFVTCTGDDSVSTDVFVVSYTVNAAATEQEHYIGQTQQTITPGAAGNVAKGPGDVTSPNRTGIGAFYAAGGSAGLYGKIALIAGWNVKP